MQLNDTHANLAGPAGAYRATNLLYRTWRAGLVPLL